MCAWMVSFPLPGCAQEEARRGAEGRAELEQQLASATSTVAILQNEKSKLQTEVQESKKEQDDLLMLLADQDQKIHSLKQKLKDLGETVEHTPHHSPLTHSLSLPLSGALSALVRLRLCPHRWTMKTTWTPGTRRTTTRKRRTTRTEREEGGSIQHSPRRKRRGGRDCAA